MQTVQKLTQLGFPIPEIHRALEGTFGFSSALRADQSFSLAIDKLTTSEPELEVAESFCHICGMRMPCMWHSVYDDKALWRMPSTYNELATPPPSGRAPPQAIACTSPQASDVQDDS